MLKFINVLVITTLIGCTNRDASVNKKDLLGTDYRLFQGLNSWNLAKAVQDQDTLRLKPK